MNFTDVFIRRPVLATVLSLLLLLLGLKAFTSLQLRQYPEITYPAINVTTVYPGAAASLVKGFLTTPILNAVSSAEGVDYLTATSTDGSSSVVIYLTPGYDVDAAFLEVSAKVNKIRSELPRDSEDPLVEKMEGAGADTLQYLSFASDTMSEEQITDFLSKVVMPEITTVEGMGRADIQGKRSYAMRVWLDAERMAAFDVSSADVQNALRRNNFQTAAGTTQGAYVATSVSAETGLSTVEQFRDIVIRASEGTLVHLGDVARVEMGSEHYREVIRYGGKPTVFVKTVAAARANPVEVARNVRTLMPELREQLPPELKMELVFDTTYAIEDSIREVVKTLAEASIIVVLVIFLFLGSLRSVIIPVVTIPLSLIGVMFVMLLLDFSVNLLTLLAMVLAIGLVVDDAIVVVENIQRHIEEGMAPRQAAFSGAREIAFPVIAMTVTLAAVYGPIGFLGGLTGTLFTEFAFTLAGAVIVSGVVALTLSPMMCSRLLLPEEKQGVFISRVNVWLDIMRDFYQRALHEAMQMRWLTLLFCAIVLTCIYFLYDSIQQELAPQEDDGVVIVTGVGPISANTDYMARYATQAEELIEAVPERDKSFIWIHGTRLFSLLILDRWEDRERSAKEIGEELLGHINAGVTGLQLYTYNMPSLPGATPGLPMQYVLTSTASDELLFQVAQRLTEEARDSGLFTYVNYDLKFNKPELQVKIDRAKAGELGVSMEEIGTALSAFLGEAGTGRFSIDNRSYKVIAQADKPFRYNPEDIGNYHVRTAGGELVPMSTFVTLEVKATPNNLTQFQQLNSTYIGAMLAPGVSMGDALAFMEEASQRLLPEGFDHDYVGQARQYLEEGNVLLLTFGFSFLLIYLVLAAQFESFRDPVIVLISVPMSICGALIPLALGLSTMNIYSQIGLVTLIGLISKHGILIVDFANKLQDRGLSVMAAAEQAAAVRLRPILMTTAAMVFGVLPLLLASGAGAESRFSIGLVITAGMAIGTVFTLFAVPVLYTYIASPRPPVADPAEGA